MPHGEGCVCMACAVSRTAARLRGMPSNPKDSEWYATTQDKRTRKMVGLTLSDAARERLVVLAKRRKTTKSAVVEALILEAKK